MSIAARGPAYRREPRGPEPPAWDGMERGHVLAIQKYGERMVDKTDATKPTIKLPDERNGLLMVFRTFDRLSYALVLDITDGVKVGDRLINPR